jgi:hypothetical protein
MRHREIALHINCNYNGGHVYKLGAADGEVPLMDTVPEISGNPLCRKYMFLGTIDF